MPDFQKLKDVLQQSVWHTLPVESVFTVLESDPEGLTDDQVQERRKALGLNTLPAQQPPKLLVIFFRQFLSPLIYVLLIAAVVSLIIGDRKDALFIFAVILLNAVIGAFQEWKAEKNAAELQNLLKIVAQVRREGSMRAIGAEELVVGDIVALESGVIVPADIRLFETANLTIDESLLTGESLTAEKCAMTMPVADIPPGDRANMAYAGSVAMTGRGLGVVVQTGLRTEVGKIVRSVSQGPATKTPLILRMEQFSGQVAVIFVASCGLLALMALARGFPPTEVFFVAIALAVAAIPEGLPVALTIALSVASQRMTKRNVIVRKLTAVEGLGSCTCIASDKTGTLTLNRQTVRTLTLPDQTRCRLSGEGYTDDGELVPESGEAPLTDADRVALSELAKAAALCNEATLTLENGQWQTRGDAVDLALLAFARKAGVDIDDLRERTGFVARVPYESEKRYAAVFYRDRENTVGIFKGAADTLLPLCATEENPLPPWMEGDVLRLSREGYRVIVVAQGVRREAGSSANEPEKANAGEGNSDDIEERAFLPLRLLGILGLIDPLRPEAAEAVKTCRQAGIRVIMITGDHPETAFAIARQLNIAESREQAVSGPELETLSAADGTGFLEAVNRASVFARVQPLQKLQIVETLRRLGHFVAVTGDGVNDAPALKVANIGVAMGSGTDVARSMASIVVTDDNFASIVAGVEEGRFAYANIRKVVYLLIATGIAEVVLFTLALLGSIHIPLLAVQLLWLNLVTNGIQHVGLSLEQGEPGALRRPPRRPTESIFNARMIQQTAVTGLTMGVVSFLAWQGWLRSGYGEDEARNLTLLLLVLFENVHVLNCRSEYLSVLETPISKNWFILIVILAAQGLHIWTIYSPWMQGVLKVQPVSVYEWLYCLLLASSVLMAGELFKLIKRKTSTAR
jgi:magnesium-transporting ATPase (P-type)